MRLMHLTLRPMRPMHVTLCSMRACDMRSPTHNIIAG